MEKEKLRIIKRLPQIILPANKNEMFLKWYDEDLRFQDEIPKAFERGYIFAENTFIDNKLIDFSKLAKIYKTTYRKIENTYNEFIKLIDKPIIYFEFKDSYFYIKVYINSELASSLEMDLSLVDKAKPNLPIVEKIQELIKEKGFMDCFTYYCFVLSQCCLWYIATASKTTKYYREGKQEPYYYEKKEIINPKRNKTISTPIYDMNKIKRVKVEGLIKRRRGWTYSHSFQVHGHYRHYADGKVIFIQPFIKGKGKEEISQVITLNPEGE